MKVRQVTIEVKFVRIKIEFRNDIDLFYHFAIE